MKALVLEQQDGNTLATLQTRPTEDLPVGDVLVDVQWSCLNYKDALAITGKKKIVHHFPMVPGIDFAGIVHYSDDARFHVGQPVVLTGYGVGEHHWGGMAEQARVNGDWLIPLPQGLDTRNSMIIGTAGLTAMLCVMALEEGGVTPDQGEVLVTGASGGVGSFAISLLCRLGYLVAAVSGRASNDPYLKKLGVNRILPRSDFMLKAPPLGKQCWYGAIDTVGGQILATVLSQMHYHSTVAACGLAGGMMLPTTVMPFILRHVRLQGIDSVITPLARRRVAWQRLTALLPESCYQQIASEITLDQVVTSATALLENQVTGRILIKIR